MTFAWVDLIGTTAAVLTTVCWLPQAVKIIREKDTRALSLITTVAFTIGIVVSFSNTFPELLFGLSVAYAISGYVFGVTRWFQRRRAGRRQVAPTIEEGK